MTQSSALRRKSTSDSSQNSISPLSGELELVILKMGNRGNDAILEEEEEEQEGEIVGGGKEQEREGSVIAFSGPDKGEEELTRSRRSE